MQSTPSETNQADAGLHCFACGYDLRSLDIKGTCPECGYAISESLAARKSVSKRELAALVCKVVALVMAFRGLWDAITLGLSLGYLPTGYLVVALLSIFVPLGLSALLWWAADWIAARMVRADGRAGFSITASDLTSVAFSTVGLVILVLGMTRIPWLCVDTVVAWREVVTGGTMIVVGLATLLGAQGLVNLLHLLRSAGTRKPKAE
jgi:hypothetical protein